MRLKMAAVHHVADMTRKITLQFLKKRVKTPLQAFTVRWLVSGVCHRNPALLLIMHLALHFTNGLAAETLPLPNRHLRSTTYLRGKPCNHRQANVRVQGPTRSAPTVVCHWIFCLLCLFLLSLVLQWCKIKQKVWTQNVIAVCFKTHKQKPQAESGWGFSFPPLEFHKTS